MANNAVTPADHLLADELSKVIGRPDLGVMAGRKANASGQLGYSMASFPRIPIPSGYQANWTMIHAIARQERSEEHTSELQSLMRISYAVFCLKKKTKKIQHLYTTNEQSILQYNTRHS